MAKSGKASAKSTDTVAKLKSSYDLVVRGGRVIDPANGIDGVRDIGVRKGRVAAVAPDLDAGNARIVDATGLIVTPGLIDTHAHVYEHVSGDFGLNPDLVGVRSGVTTVVDQGGPSALTFDGFRKFIVEQAKTRVLAFVSAYLAGGLLGLSSATPRLFGLTASGKRKPNLRISQSPNAAAGSSYSMIARSEAAAVPS